MLKRTHKFVEMLGEFEKLRVLRVDPTTYSQVGLSAIGQYLFEHGYSDKTSMPLGFMPFIDAKSGKIATRVDKYVLAATGKKLTTRDKEEIGNIASRYVSREDDVLFDLHNGVLDWPNGDFGNSGSCWRNSYLASIPMLQDGSGHGPGFVMRLFSSSRGKGVGSYYGGVGGYGRIWLLPWKNSLIAFNPYGQKVEWFVDRLIKILSENTNEKLFFKRIKVSNTNSGLYMNGESAMITSGKPTKERDITTRMPKYLTKTCLVCHTKYARKPEEEKSSSEGFCQECGKRCGVTSNIEDKRSMIEIVIPITIAWRNKPITVSFGFISKVFDSQVEFCTNCLAYHGTEGCKHETTN